MGDYHIDVPDTKASRNRGHLLSEASNLCRKKKCEGVESMTMRYGMTHYGAVFCKRLMLLHSHLEQIPIHEAVQIHEPMIQMRSDSRTKGDRDSGTQTKTKIGFRT